MDSSSGGNEGGRTVRGRPTGLRSRPRPFFRYTCLSLGKKRPGLTLMRYCPHCFMYRRYTEHQSILQS